jgi:hypothetical protein
MAESSTFPFVPQTVYVDIPEAPLVGDLWEGELYNERVSRGFIAKVTPVSQENEILIAANNPTDAVGVYIDGGLIPVVAGADAPATAVLLKAAIEAAGYLTPFIDSVTIDSATVTINWADYAAHTVVEYSPAATTATVTTPTAAVGQEQLLYGMGVVRKLPITTAMNTAIGKPASLTDMFVGVLIRTHGTNLPAAQIEAAGFDPEYLCPGYAYSVAAQNLGVVVDYIGEAPLVGDPVYLIMTGANAGLWRASSGAASQVTQGDVESNYVAGTAQVTRGDLIFNGTDAVGLNVDGMAPLFVLCSVDADTTVAALAVAWNANPAYFALATATTVTAGAEADIVLTFKDTLVHTVTGYSPATADVTGIVNTTAAVAAVHDNVGLTVDSLPNLYVASITDDDATATALAAAWNGSASHAAVATASANLAGATSLIVLTFLDDQTHTVAAYSPATADITSIANTTVAVAETAKLIPNYSWGRPSITVGDPTRAFLRLANP